MKNYSRKNARGNKTAYRTPSLEKIRKSQKTSKDKSVYLKKRSPRGSLRKG